MLYFILLYSYKEINKKSEVQSDYICIETDPLSANHENSVQIVILLYAYEEINKKSEVQ